ncbi:Integrase/recombinase [Commensalibacter communis]|uniref:Includes phage integrase (FimB) n=1 Tax=Commensalibacter communis TaxID=2972786 RepID=A0A9W4TME2_9PROT|nr:integrase arm-type DNA-binding domain-containing protein [Commensalibacter communis]CAI3947185.1 Integrase/recombinase [Commensalibacter communis]CAI3947644.1 Integrase/recombinase [Commensalibacter communis]
MSHGKKGKILTDRDVKNAKPKDNNYKLYDFEGLHILVKKNGSKLWHMDYRFAGKPNVYTIGKYPLVSLAQARIEKDKARKLIAKNIDPNKEKKRHQLTHVDNNFEAIAKKWFGIKKTLWKEKHATSVWRSLERCIFPYIGKVAVNDIDTPLILSVIQKIEKNGATDTAHRVRQRVESIFNYAISIGIVMHNPATVIKGALKPTIKRKHPAVTDIDKLREVIFRTDNTPAHPLTKLALRFLALTAVRSSELRGMTWDEVEGDVWTIPAERMKRTEIRKETNEPHIVPLSRQALETLDVVKQLTGHQSFVFLSISNRSEKLKPMSENAMGYLLNRAGYHGRHVPHGFRASFSTIMNEHFPRESYLFEKMLSHQEKNKVEAAYNRAQHLERRKEYFQFWADLLFKDLVAPDALLPLTRR